MHWNTVWVSWRLRRLGKLFGGFINGVRAGLDEVLEAALRQILGAGVPDAQIEAMAAIKPR
jgi:hypothetical protein